MDERLYNNMERVRNAAPNEIDEEIHNLLSLEERLAVAKEMKLVVEGDRVIIGRNNLNDYLKGCLKYKMLGQVKKEVAELLYGFFEVIPEPLLAVFDFEELELLMHGAW